MKTLWDFIRPIAELVLRGPADDARRPISAPKPTLKPTSEPALKPASKPAFKKAPAKRRPRPSPPQSHAVARAKPAALLAQATAELLPLPGIAPPPARRREPTSAHASTTPKVKKAVRTTAQERYDEVVRQMLSENNIKIRRWRKSMSGLATLVSYRDGSTKRLIESPRPKSPLSMSIFLHEVGHHVIGIGIHKPRCLEELLAWEYSIATMTRLGLPVTEKVQRRMRRSLEYAVDKARRRGIRNIPQQLAAYDKSQRS